MVEGYRPITGLEGPLQQEVYDTFVPEDGNHTPLPQPELLVTNAEPTVIAEYDSFDELAAHALVDHLPTNNARGMFLNRQGKLNEMGKKVTDIMTLNVLQILEDEGEIIQTFEDYSSKLSEVYAYVRDAQHAGDEEFAEVDLEMLRRMCTSSRYSFRHDRFEESRHLVEAPAEKEVVETVAPVAEVKSTGRFTRLGQRMRNGIEATKNLQWQDVAALGTAAFAGIGLFAHNATDVFSKNSEPLEPHRLAAQVSQQAQAEPIMRLSNEIELDTAPTTKRELPQEDIAAVEEADEKMALLDFEPGEKVTLDIDGAQATFIIEDEIDLDTVDLADFNGSIEPSDNDLALKLTWTNSQGETVIVYLAHSDAGGAATQIRDAASARNLTDKDGKAFSDSRGEEDITVPRSASIPVHAASIQSLMASLPGGTFLETCETYRRGETESWRLIELQPTPAPSSAQAEVEKPYEVSVRVGDQDIVVAELDQEPSRGLRAQIMRSARTKRLIREAERAALTEARQQIAQEV